MGFLTNGDPVRVDLGDGFWVDLRPGLSFGDLSAAQRLLSQYQMSENEVIASPDLGQYQLTMVSRSILSWNLTDENDIALPLAPVDKREAAIRRLPQWAFNAIYTKVTELNNPRSKDEDAQFPAASPSGDSGSEQD